MCEAAETAILPTTLSNCVDGIAHSNSVSETKTESNDAPSTNDVEEDHSTISNEIHEESSSTRMTGALKCFSTKLEYGFLYCEDTNEHYLVPACNIETDISEHDFSSEWPVEFELTEGPRGVEADRLIFLAQWPERNKDGEFDPDNLDVMESNPEALIEPEDVKEDKPVIKPQLQQQKQLHEGSKKSGKEVGISARVKWFNCKKWYGTITREGTTDEPLFLKLNIEAISLLKKRGVSQINGQQRVSVDIDWDSKVDMDDSSNDQSKSKDDSKKKIPPCCCTDIRIIEEPKKTASDLRKNLNSAKVAGKQASPSSAVKRRRETKGGDSVLAKRPTGRAVSSGGSWRSPPQRLPYSSNTAASAHRHGPSHAVMQQRYPPPPPPLYGGQHAYNSAQMMFRNSSSHPHHPNGHSTSQPSQYYASGPYKGPSTQSQSTGYGGVMPPLLPSNRSISPPRRNGGSGFGRSVTMPNLMSGSVNPLKGLYENAQAAVMQMNPYQQREMAMSQQTSSYSSQFRSHNTNSTGSGRYFEPRINPYSMQRP